MKRLVSIVLCLVMLAGLLPVVAMADSKSSGYRITKGSELYEELGKLAALFGDTTDQAVAAVNRWLSGELTDLSPEGTKEALAILEKSGADKAAIERFMLDQRYITVIFFESVFNYGAQIGYKEMGKDAIDAMRVIDDNILPLIDQVLNVLTMAQSGAQADEFYKVDTEIRTKIIELVDKAFFDNPGPEMRINFYEDLRQMLKEKATNRASNLHDRFYSYMEGFCAVMGLEDAAAKKWMKEVDTWLAAGSDASAEEGLELLSMSEIVCALTAKTMAFMNVLDWSEGLTTTKKIRVFLENMQMILPEMINYMEANRDKDYLKVISISGKLYEETNSMFEQVLEPGEEYDAWLAEYEQIREQIVPKDYTAVKDLALLAAGAVLGRVVQTTAKVTVRMLVAPAVGVLLLTGAARMLRNLTPTFIPRLFW